MIASKLFWKLIFLICVPKLLVESKKQYPRIQDVVSFSKRQESLYYLPRIVQEIRSSIDIDKFRRDEATFRRQIRGNFDDTILLEGKPDFRRVQVYNEKKANTEEYQQASEIQFRTKIVDCMLQLVYMARHYMKLFERKEYVDPESSAYRIGFLARKLRYNFKKSLRILEMLNVKLKKRLWTEGSVPALNLHHKVAKMHVDFNFYYEVLKKLHAKIRERSNLPLETPPLKRKPQIW